MALDKELLRLKSVVKPKLPQRRLVTKLITPERKQERVYVSTRDLTGDALVILG